MRRRIAGALACTALLAGCGGSGGGGSDGKKTEQVETTTTRVEVVEGIGAEGGGFDPRAIYDKEAPGVVTIISVFEAEKGGGIGDILGGGNEGGEGGGGLGSGFVLNGEGEVVTNAHVVTTGEGSAMKKADQVFVSFADGNRVPADIQGYDPDADVALLKIDPSGLKLNPLPLGDSAKVQVGTPVAAMGSPFGEEQSLSVGVVSAVDRNVSSLTKFSISNAIQTDAAINPGNSGGPLVDSQGRVIGLNQQIQTRSGGGEGVGFAVPIDLAKRSVDQLRDKGRVDYAYIGVSSQALYPQLAEHFDLPTERGAWLQEVTPGGPADRAGLKGGGKRENRFQASTFLDGGDVVVEVDGKPVRDSNDLGDAVAAKEPGDTVDVVVYRGDARKTVKVTLAKRPVTAGGR
jgi:S1-C subfamily serine protease